MQTNVPIKKTRKEHLMRIQRFISSSHLNDDRTLILI